MPFHTQLLPQLGRTALNVGTNLLTNRLLPSINLPGMASQRQPIFSLQNLLGGGLLLGGALADKEPGEVLEARQFLRNQFTSPTATTDILGRNLAGTQQALAPLFGQIGPTGTGQQFLTGQLQPQGIAQRFAGQIPALAEQFQPLLTQQRQRGIEAVQRRYAAAFPGTVGAQGPEFTALSRYITDEALPREQALLGDIGLNLLSRQEQAAQQLYADEQARRTGVGALGANLLGSQLGAAGTILETSKPDPTAAAISQLGGMLLARDLLGGQGGQGGTTLLSQTGQPIGQVGANGQLIQALTQGGLNALLSGQLSQPQAAQMVGALSQLLGGIQIGGFEQLSGGGTGILDQAGNIVATIGRNGVIIDQRTGQVLSGQIAGGGLGGLGTALGAVGAGVGGTMLGRQIGSSLFGTTAETARNANIGGAGGALAGAAIGTAILPGVGTVIGAGLGGAAGGTLGAGTAQPDISRKETFQGALGGAFGGVGGFFASQGDVSTGQAIKDAAIITVATILGGPGAGAIAGGIIGKQRGAALEKQAFRREDLSSQADQVQEIGSFFLDEMASLQVPQEVYDRLGFGLQNDAEFIKEQMRISESGAEFFTHQGVWGTLDQQQAVAKVGGNHLLLLYRNYVDPSVRTLDDVPGLRQRFIDYLTRTTTSAGNSSFGGGPALNQFPPWWESSLSGGLLRGGPGGDQGLTEDVFKMLRFRRGGLLRSGTALVGETAPELLTMTPHGALVTPLSVSRN